MSISNVFKNFSCVEKELAFIELGLITYLMFLKSSTNSFEINVGLL